MPTGEIEEKAIELYSQAEVIGLDAVLTLSQHRIAPEEADVLLPMLVWLQANVPAMRRAHFATAPAPSVPEEEE